MQILIILVFINTLSTDGERPLRMDNAKKKISMADGETMSTSEKSIIDAVSALQQSIARQSSGTMHEQERRFSPFPVISLISQ